MTGKKPPETPTRLYSNDVVAVLHRVQGDKGVQDDTSVLFESTKSAWTKASTALPLGLAAAWLMAALLAALPAAGARAGGLGPRARLPEERAMEVESPNGQVHVRFYLDAQGRPVYTVSLNGASLLKPSPLGLVTSVGRWERGLAVVAVSDAERVREQYGLMHGKCSTCRYEANRRTVRVRNEGGRSLTLAFQVSDDGVAFRYRLGALEGVSADSVTAERELTGFRFPASARKWALPMDPPKTGFANTNPSYEGYYTMGAPAGQVAPFGVGWAFPALFHEAGTGWALVTEAALDGSYVASRLDTEEGAQGGHAKGALQRIAFPAPGEGRGAEFPVAPVFSLPFASPWRVIIVGKTLAPIVGKTLAPIVESTLVTDVSPPSVLKDAGFVQPGKAAWSWLPLKDASIVPAVQRRFIDMAAAQGYEYCLVDALWDQQIGYEGLEALVDYAADRGVGVWVWYNSNGDYNDAPQTPKNRMYTARERREEFARLRDIGVKGVKVDFFGGDKQFVVQHYLHLFRDAAAYDLLVNVHGATLPRGWQRTYPNFMTAEAVQGYEYITFSQDAADRAPTHAATLPFTRNVVGPMDFTPTMLTDSVGVAKRRTSNAFDVAMTVVFESGVQHLGVTPESLARVPEYVRAFLSDVPVAWDETRFLAGFPGTYAVLARRKGNRWYVGGINGQEAAQTVTVAPGFLNAPADATLITDGDDLRSFERQQFSLDPAGSMRVAMPGHGGFVMVLRPGS